VNKLYEEEHRLRFAGNFSAMQTVLLAAIMITCFFALDMAAGQMPTIESFSASPETVILGSCSTLNWSTTNAESVYIDPGIGSVQPNGTMYVKPNVATRYIMVASNGSDSTSDSVDVNVIKVLPVVNYLKADPKEVGPGNSSNLSWNVTGATLGVTIDPDGSTVPMVGNITVYPVGNTKYTLNATNESGSNVKICSVGCSDPSAYFFMSIPSEVLYGDSSLLMWRTYNASRVSIDQDVGSVNTTGITIVYPKEKTTYTIKASNTCNENEYNTTTVDVYHTIFDFIYSGQYASWTGSNGRINCCGSQDDSDGSVALITGELTGTGQDELLLWAHPTWNGNGYIEGVYDLSNWKLASDEYYKPNQMDHIIGDFGILDDSCASILCPWCDDGKATFKIILRSQGVPDFTLVGPVTLNCRDAPSHFDAYIPAQFLNRPINIVLRAEAGSGTSLDRACWKNVVLWRGPVS